MITDRYRELVNAMRSKNGMAPAFPAAAEAPDSDIVDANDKDDDGGALELLRRGVKIVNREREDDGDDVKDEFSAIGANAAAARRLARLTAQVPQDPTADEARAKAAKDAAAFVLSCHKAAGWMK